ncbi:hypothetical protein ACH0BF_23780 [Pseudobacillus sp. 179-B 2D1 NHS]|uniref:hypothetical protein n=1 Tax=Pseudobacillus sp. 179-B 2D1 NHS TaxID=3374292 RepID=UPI0038795E63
MKVFQYVIYLALILFFGYRIIEMLPQLLHLPFGWDAGHMLIRILLLFVFLNKLIKLWAKRNVQTAEPLHYDKGDKI